MTAYPLSPTAPADPALLLDASDAADVAIEDGDLVTFHADFGDYDAKVISVSPATRFTAERYHLHVWAGSDYLTWVHCLRERVTLRVKNAALEATKAASA